MITLLGWILNFGAMEMGGPCLLDHPHFGYIQNIVYLSSSNIWQYPILYRVLDGFIRLAFGFCHFQPLSEIPAIVWRFR